MSQLMNKIVQIANDTRKLLVVPDNFHIDLHNMNNRIVSLMGINILFTNSNIFDGCLRWNRRLKKPEIIVSNKDNYYRQEFTIAHELGHLLLHWKWNPSVDLTKSVIGETNVLDTYKYKHPTMFRGLIGRLKKDYESEKQANEFAANLLMPAKDIKKIYTESPDKDLDYVKKTVSSDLDVSYDAAYHRLNNLQKRGELSN